MTKLTSVLSLVILASSAPVLAAPKKKPPKEKKQPANDPQPPKEATNEQKEADRHFKNGVELYKESKWTEALAEFERAYEVSPHPLVLYNIAACHRELSRYQEAVKFYTRFLTEGKGKVPAARLSSGQTELDGILARIARVTVTISPDGAVLYVDGKELGTLVEMPLILSPGEHKLIAKAQGRTDASRVLRVASGDEVTVELSTTEAPPPGPRDDSGPKSSALGDTAPKRFAVGAAFGTNLRAAGDTGAPSIGLAVQIGSRIQLGADAIVVAYAVMPSLRIRLAGDAFSVHAIGAVPIAFPDGEMTETFVAGAVGLGLRYRPVPMFALKLESLASFAGGDHGTTIPTFVGGELWF